MLPKSHQMLTSLVLNALCVAQILQIIICAGTATEIGIGCFCGLALDHRYETAYFIVLLSPTPLFATVYLQEIHTSHATFATLN